MWKDGDEFKIASVHNSLRFMIREPFEMWKKNSENNKKISETNEINIAI